VILKKDPILKARVLALVNSAYYKRTKKQITEIETAIQMVGLDTINSLFVSFIVKGMIKLNPQHYKLFGHFIWRHLLETAVISQRIAGEYEAKNPFLCYLTGLIHDLGKVIIFLCKSQQWQDQLSLKHLGSDAFKRALTERSLKLSRYIVEDWPLPAELVYAVNSYHQPQQTEPYAQVLQIANRTSELHMQIKAKIINLDTANEHLIISGLTQAQSQQCLKAMENIPPL
jgi:HD-like signal output (HDOD) protein